MRFAAVFAALLFASCAQNEPSEATTVAGNTATAPSNTINPPVPPERDDPSNRIKVAPPVQDVQLIEYSIRMPDTLPAGAVAFNVRNGGEKDHGFEIEGIEEKTQILKRGDTATLNVDLKPGTYTVYCPVKGHKERGMRRRVTVK